MRTCLVVVVVGALGCSSHYIPQRPGQIGVIMQNGAPAYVRDGHVYEHGLLGGGLLDAVQGNPRAMDAAHEYRSRVTTGLVLGIGGAVCTGVALGVGLGRLAAEDTGS